MNMLSVGAPQLMVCSALAGSSPRLITTPASVEQHRLCHAANDRKTPSQLAQISAQVRWWIGLPGVAA